MSLPNSRSHIDSWEPIRQSKTFRNEKSAYAGTSSISSAFSNKFNTHAGIGVGNQVINASFRSTAADQKYVNLQQYVFVETYLDNDADKPHTDTFMKPRLVSIQQINKTLAEAHISRKKMGKVRSKTKMTERDFITERYKAFGVVATGERPLDETNPHYSGRYDRAYTVSISGPNFVYDYWSNKNYSLKPNANVYFVLKKVKIPEFHSYQASLSAFTEDSGENLGELKDEYVWQIVPHATSKASIEQEDYMFEDVSDVDKDKKVEKVGFYWHVGTVHEDPTILPQSSYKTRDKLSVSRDIQYLTMNGRTQPFQMYIKCDMENRVG